MRPPVSDRDCVCLAPVSIRLHSRLYGEWSDVTCCLAVGRRENHDGTKKHQERLARLIAEMESDEAMLDSASAGSAAEAFNGDATNEGVAHEAPSAAPWTGDSVRLIVCAVFALSSVRRRLWPYAVIVEVS